MKTRLYKNPHSYFIVLASSVKTKEVEVIEFHRIISDGLPVREHGKGVGVMGWRHAAYDWFSQGEEHTPVRIINNPPGSDTADIWRNKSTSHFIIFPATKRTAYKTPQPPGAQRRSWSKWWVRGKPTSQTIGQTWPNTGKWSHTRSPTPTYTELRFGFRRCTAPKGKRQLYMIGAAPKYI